MTEIDALLLIDANKYLDLYRTDSGRKLLAPLSEQSDYIFVTRQIVDEVQRNKLNVVSDFLRNKVQGLKLQGINVPDHFSGLEVGRNQKILSEMRAISKSVASLSSEIESHVAEIMGQVAESKDEVSIALASIFSNAVSATSEEIRLARQRKELGNPPGKKGDPLGDEITWEQVLSNFKGKKRLWIISRDGDYGSAFGKNLFVNSFLRSELSEVSPDPDIYIFSDIVEGLTHFVDTTKVEANIKLTPEEFAEIESEEKSLNYFSSIPSSSLPSDADLLGFDMQKFLIASRPSESLSNILNAAKSVVDLPDFLNTAQHMKDLSSAMSVVKAADIPGLLNTASAMSAAKAVADMPGFLSTNQYAESLTSAMSVAKTVADIPGLLNTAQYLEGVSSAMRAATTSMNPQKEFGDLGSVGRKSEGAADSET